MDALDDFDIPIDVFLEGEFAPEPAASPAGVTILKDEVEIMIAAPAQTTDARTDARIATLEALLERVRARRRPAAS